jgi:uncharacterized membrane protein
MSTARKLLVIALLTLVVLYALWFGGMHDWFALLVFALPAAWLAASAARAGRRAGFWSGVLALLWFSHGIMVAWTRPPERGYALAEVVLAVAIVLSASVPGLRARFAKRPPAA